ncbi:MAG: hypothetical protein GYA24_01180 [Candidatus Lokiarchaeota archaeon]|nr:hypothetical protein [Candidatus Lokiarchaeota archaeon]
MVGSIHDIIASRGVLDHDIFTDRTGNILFSLGHYQPLDRVISLLKYVPDAGGTWVHRVSGQHYTRSYQHQGIDAFTSATRVAGESAGTELARWQVIDPVFGTSFLEVPHDQINAYFLPEARLAGILESSDRDLDTLELKVKHVVQAILKHAGTIDMTAENMGITGSILWRGHSDRSDINLNVYGVDVCKELERMLASLAQRRVQLAGGMAVEMKGFDDVPGIQHAGQVTSASLKRKPKIKIDGFKPGIQLRWCLKKGEFPVVYGTESYVDRGLATITARVVDDRFTLFFPAMVSIETITGRVKPERVLIYDTRFTRLLRSGDVVEITGLFQEINDSGRSQLLIGSKHHARDERVSFLETTRQW